MFLRVILRGLINTGPDVDVLLVKMMPPSWRSVFALVGLLTRDFLCLISLCSNACGVVKQRGKVLYSEQLLAVFI